MSVARIKQRLNSVLQTRGVRGMVGLKRAFQEMDLDGNHVLDFEEFSSAIVKCGLGLSHQDLRLLFLDFDQDGNGVVDWEEFMAAVRGELSPQRRQLIASLFDRINQDGTGVITITDIGRCFQPQHHPEVKSGNKDIPSLLSEFLDTWEALAKQGTINLDGFLEYYASVSSFLESDEDFEQMLSSLWNVPASRAPRRGASSLRNFAPEETKGNSTRTLASVSAGASLNHVQTLLGKLKEQLASRGARGIIGLQRKFRIMDDDGSQCLSRAEFKKGITECALSLSDEEMNALFQYFDKDRSGTLDFDEFLVGIRGVLNDRRRGLVELAFAKIDKDGNGTIEPQDIVDCYDASKHPDVIAGKKTPDEVFREFLDTFDVGGEVDGKVTQNEFMNYYANVSASIDDDDYFELMIRNAWHISGGEGWSANSSNRRVLVTHADGRQSVEEIKDDLGVKADDKEEMMRRLRSQGIDPSNIALFGGGEDGVEGTDGPVNQGPSLSSSAPSRRSNPSFRSSFQLG